MRKRKREPIYYDARSLPPRVYWTIACRIPRVDLPQLCEQIHSMVCERTGASFYYPDTENNTTKCRYEWHIESKGKKFNLRVGMTFSATNCDVDAIEAYLTTNRIVKDPSVGAPRFSSKLIKRAQREVSATILEAIARSEPSRQMDRYPLFYIEMPYMLGIHKTLTTDDGGIRLFPTTIVKNDNKRVSAVSIRVRAASNESSKAEALRVLGVLVALLTLANDSVYKTPAALRWSRRRRPTAFLDSIDNVEVERLYPYLKSVPLLEQCDERIGDRLKWVWNAYGALNGDQQNSFVAAVFAYYSGRMVSGSQPTLSIVAHLASLSSLALDKIRKCEGIVTCAKCGTLDNFQHNSVGDRLAIQLFLSDILGVEDKPKEKKDLYGLINSVYNKQRSAYVHGAELRHEEHHQGSGLPAAFPTETEAVRDVYFFRSDLVSFERLVRRALLQWLARTTDHAIDNNLFDIGDLKFRFALSHEMTVALPAARVVTMK